MPAPSNTLSTHRNATLFPSLITGRYFRNWSGLVLALVVLADVSAQQVIMPAPQESLVAPVLRPTGPEAAPAATDFQAFPNGPSIVAGQFVLRPHLFASIVHADGLPVQGTTRVTSDIFTVAPGLQADLGTHWTFDYTATSHNYSAAELHDAVDQDFRLVGGNKSPDWRLQLNESYSISSSILSETAQQTKQKNWLNSISVDHDFGNLLHYLGTFALNDMKTEGFTETRDWQTEQDLNAKVSSKVEAGFGLGLGYSDVVAHPNSRYEKYLGNLKWRPTGKIDLSLQAGWQNWHSLATAGGDQHNPVLQARLGWQPFEQTKVAFSGSRTTSNSLTGDSVTEEKDWNLSVNQRLLGRLLLTLAYNQDSSDYRFNVGNFPSFRSDRVKAFSAALSTQLFKYWTLGATYHSAKNDSSLAGFSYSSRQYGLELSGRF